MTHHIAEIDFAGHATVGTMTCACRWQGSTDQYAAHRRSVGAAQRTVGNTSLGPGGERGPISIWRRTK